MMTTHLYQHNILHLVDFVVTGPEPESYFSQLHEVEPD